MGLPQSLDLCYEAGFLGRWKREIPPVFSDPLFIPHMAKVVFNVVKPPVVLKALPSATGREALSAEASGTKESTPSASPPHQPDQGQISETLSTDMGKTDEATQRRNLLLRAARSNCPLSLRSTATRTQPPVPRMVLHLPKY